MVFLLQLRKQLYILKKIVAILDTQWPSSLRILPYPWTSFLSPLYALVKALMFPFCCCSRFRLYCWQFSITIATPPIIFTYPIESPLILLIMFLPYYINSVIVIFLRLLPLLLSLPLLLLIHDDVPLTYPVPIFSVFPPTPFVFFSLLLDNRKPPSLNIEVKGVLSINLQRYLHHLYHIGYFSFLVGWLLLFLWLNK